MDLKLFTKNEKELLDHPCNIVCSICLNVEINPCVSKNCFHSFCCLCITNWKNESKKNLCPECRVGPLEIIKDYRNERMINRLEIKCDEEKCNFTGNVKEFQEHNKLFKCKYTLKEYVLFNMLEELKKHNFDFEKSLDLKFIKCTVEKINKKQKITADEVSVIMSNLIDELTK